jgi:hypothetical protein
VTKDNRSPRVGMGIALGIFYSNEPQKNKAKVFFES